MHVINADMFYRPNVQPGYVDPSAIIDFIAVTGVPGTNGSFQGHVQLVSSKPGMQDICIQTANPSG